MPLPPVLLNRLVLPVMAAPMFLVSQPDLVIAACTAGIIGSFPALNARPTAQLDEWLHRIVEALAEHDRTHDQHRAGPYAVNQIVHRSNARIDADMDLMVKYKVPIIITSLGLREDIIAAVHGYGGLVFHDVTTLAFAHKAAERGVDGLIAVATGAGGHAGRLSPFALVEEIRAWWNGPLVLAGAIATGRGVLAAQAMGADLAYIGSAFIGTNEAQASPEYKRMVVASSGEDIVYTKLFTGIYGNYLRASVAAAGYDPDAISDTTATTLDFIAGGNAMARAWRDVWGCGQGIGSISATKSAAEFVGQLRRDYDAAREALGRVGR